MKRADVFEIGIQTESALTSESDQIANLNQMVDFLNQQLTDLKRDHERELSNIMVKMWKNCDFISVKLFNSNMFSAGAKNTGNICGYKTDHSKIFCAGMTAKRPITLEFFTVKIFDFCRRSFLRKMFRIPLNFIIDLQGI